MKKILMAAFVMLCTVGCMEIIAQPNVVAHRGYWKIEGSAQNSIRSLEEAARIGAYGAECDIWLSADGVPVLSHDRTAGPDKLIVEETPSSVLTSIKLSNGEYLPTLVAYFEKARQCKDIKLILELKTHSTPEREDVLAAKVVEMVKAYGFESRVEYIAFSLHTTKALIRLAPGGVISYLNGDLSPKELKGIGCAGLDYNLNVMKKNPQWFREVRDLGLTVNVWTVNTEADMRYMIEHGADYLTTDEPELLQSLLRK